MALVPAPTVADLGSAVGAIVAVIVIGVILAITLCIAALISIANSPLPSSSKAAWVIIVLVFQFFGPLAWFAVGRAQASQPGPPRRYGN